ASGPSFTVSRVGLRQRIFAPHLDEGVQPAIVRVDAIEERGPDRARRSLALRERPRELRQRLAGKALSHWRIGASPSLRSNRPRKRRSNMARPNAAAPAERRHPRTLTFP